jgi:hypothetical protein
MPVRKGTEALLGVGVAVSAIVMFYLVFGDTWGKVSGSGLLLEWQPP